MSSVREHGRQLECKAVITALIISNRSGLVEYDLFTNAYQGFTNELNSVVVSNYAGFVGWIAGPLRTGMIIYILLLGYAIMRGAVQYPFLDSVYRPLILAALSYALTNLYGDSPDKIIINGPPT